ncbi:MAG: site-specific DNA-methyltransferase [Dorea sp.]|nr:site-specific DNA-methyltransferase [Dorea sp.]
MDKMRMESVDMTVQNIDKIGALFPNCVTEMLDEEKSTAEKKVYKKAINFELLKQMLSGDILNGDEAYEFTWVGKKASIVEANKPIRKTLRPCPEESVDWDNTENLYIEGDNLEVLKLLQESYLNSIKLIYIDPPYNTGHDFVYPDSFIMDNEDYNEGTGYFDSEGNVNYSRENSSSAGKYHSDWCSMMYSRLALARNLLSDTGVIFISIDVNEVHNLRKICDEVFGAGNFVTDIIWNSRKSVSNDAVVSLNHNYTLVYTKNMTVFCANKSKFKLPDTGEGFSNPDNDPRGPWKADPFDSPGIRPNLTYAIKNPNTGEECWPPKGRCWRTGEKEFLEFLADNRIVFGKTGNSKPQLKRFLAEAQDKGLTPKSLWDDCGTATEGTKEILDLFGSKVFDTPKPVGFVNKIIELATSGDDLVLDFFSGSATTAHAVLKFNAENNKKCKYIMVQIQESLDEKSVAANEGYGNLAEVGKERIRRAGNKIKQDNPGCSADLDTGFRVLKLNDSNMNDVYYGPAEYSQDLLPMLESNVKSDRNDLDLLFGCLLEWGLPLSLPYSSEQMEGCTIHNYNDGDLIACFNENIPDSVIKEIARRQPLRAVFRDSSFANSPSKINVGEIFKLMAPDTRVKVI